MIHSQATSSTATTTAPPPETTAQIRARSINSAIVAMREHLGEPQELTDAARAALMSPFHFHRVFRMMTAATPGRFLTAMRMSEAKRLLLETDLSATEISITVGYSSFGTFTSQFNRLVGMPPGRFRTCAAPLADVPVRVLLDQLPKPEPDGRGVCGWLSSRPDHSAGIAVVGLFTSAIAQEIPKSCAVIAPPGRIVLPPVTRKGSYVALAVSVDADATVFEVLTESPSAGLYVGAAPEPIQIRGPAMPLDEFFIALREKRITDPSVLTAFPLLAASGAPRSSQRRIS